MHSPDLSGDGLGSRIIGALRSPVSPDASAPHFLQGGGEMGARMRALDWTATPLGPPAAWPQSLKTIVRVLLDSRYAMWMLWGPQMTFFCNDAYVPTVGIKREWVLGARADKVWEEIWPDIGPRIAHVLTQGEATWDEALLLYLERSGFTEETYHTFSYSPVYDDESRIAGMLCVVTEVTDRVIGERRLRILRDLATRTTGAEGVERRCRRALQVLAQYPLDVPFAALYLSDGADGRLFTSADEREPAASSAILRAPLRTLLETAYATATVQETRAFSDLGLAPPQAQRRDEIGATLVLPLNPSERGAAGALIVGCSRRRPLDDDYRSFLSLVAGQVAATIAEAQAYEAERRRAEALAEIDRAKTVFFSNVSHEFRTPLTLLLGPLEDAIGDVTVPATVRQVLSLAHRNALRLQRLVNALLDFSRIEAARMQATYVPTDLAVLTRNLAASFRSAMERAGLAFAVDCAPLDGVAYVDPEMWEKIVLNLLSNAFKFTLAGGVTVRLRQDGDAAVLEVADTGVGIAEADLPRVFERFHRVEGTAARTHEGSGIGLALVQELVKLHGGSIAATSTPGRGTTFRIRLPLGSAHLPPDRIKAPQAQAAASTAIAAQAYVQEAMGWLPQADVQPAGPLEVRDERVHDADERFASTFGARVLLADDNADMRSYVRDLLGRSYTVETVADGREALASARLRRPDLILADVMMPNLNGFELLKALRADPHLGDVPLILLSARAGAESRVEGLGAGADDYIVKPFHARELLARVGALLELTHLRRENEARLRAYVHASSDAVYRMSADWSELREVHGHDCIAEPPRPTRTWLQKYILAEDQPQVLAAIEDARGRKKAFELEHRLIRADGSVGWSFSRAVPLFDRAGNIVEWFGTASDVTDRRAAQEALLKQQRNLEEADRQKNEFLAMLAHELRNPLAPIRNALYLLGRRDPAIPSAPVVEMLERQVSHMVRLVDDLMEVSRISRGTIELKRTPVDLEAVVQGALEASLPLVEQAKHTLVTTPAPEPLVVLGDSVRLAQVLANLLNNAVRYTDPGGRIEVRSRRDGDAACIDVIDSGIGIARDQLGRVFVMFGQLDRTNPRSEGGLGVGLALARRIVELHGGDLSVASDGIGRGSRFTLRLPLHAGARAESDADPAEVPRLSPAHAVLVVDDNRDAAESTGMLLRLSGADVKVVHHALDALALLEIWRPNVVLLDLGLPGMNGLELAKRLRADTRLRSLTIVALTGWGQQSDRERTAQAGFDHHLVKPVDPRALEMLLASLR